ncbi:MAG TPA: ethanolamine utilization protein EutN [Porticoccus sp.]|nr:ethanolamine utilization protein EutN [Porticoccus sp.]
MIRGKVVAKCWATTHIENLPKGPLLEVELASGEIIIAFDPLGCGTGEQVLITQGSTAAAWFDQANPCVDAVIIGSLDK